ncbi:MAG TPA: hypothetical protein DCR21_06880 [Succinivibrionaceae bacterium]|nr:hypothetical protein [Succinivibrionaceae bacterium]
MKLLNKEILKKIGYALLILVALILIFKSRKDNFIGISSSLADQVGILTFICFILATQIKAKLKENLLFWLVTIALYACIPLIQKNLGNTVRSNEYVASGIFGGCLYCFPLLLSAIVNTVNSRAISRISSVFVYLLTALVISYPLVFYFYYLAEDAVFSADIVLAISQTNLKESLDYAMTVYGGLNIGYYAAFLILIILAAIFIYRVKKSLDFIVIRTGIINYLLLALGCVFLYQLSFMTMFSNKGFNCLPRQVITFSSTILSSYSDFEKGSADLLKNTSISRIYENEPGIYVLVVGESENRDYMSLYGFKDDTTPLMNKLVADSSFIKYEHAYACFTHTIPVLSLALTSANQYNERVLDNSLTLIDTAKAAGFKTYWISNQAKDSLVDTPVTYLALHSDFKRFITENKKSSGDNRLYDGSILENLPKIPENESSLVIIHFMGSHSVYKDRYPENFAKFSGSDAKVAEYENSILYTDYVLNELYKHFSALPNFKAMVYFSDHGADPALKADHNVSHFNYGMVRIPMVMSFSEGYKNSHSNTYTTLLNSRDKVFTNDLAYELMLGIMGIKIETEVYKPEYDLTSENYQLDKSNAVTLHGKLKVSDDSAY